jgi:hypothetical protein
LADTITLYFIEMKRPGIYPAEWNRVGGPFMSRKQALDTLSKPSRHIHRVVPKAFVEVKDGS